MSDQTTKHLLIGTAGHVDHGKTALIGALTGIDTDRLEEEHERGISIVLGFAPYKPKGDLDAQVGVIDVPGHERFIKTMVAGATGVDVALFVIACDEGVKPQTLEHLEILTLLGVEHGVIALTKIDLIDDPEWTELVAEEVRDLVAPTFLAGAPIIPVSAVTGEGLDDLRDELERLLALIPERETGASFRLPIDRSFSVKGIGTVVTGSVWSGTVKVGEHVEIQPSGTGTRVREIQQHGASSKETSPGTRTALALHSVSVNEASPGSWLVTPKSVSPTRTVDLKIVHLDSAPGPLKHNQRIRVHHGTMETFGRLRILGAESLQPGEEGFAQLHLEGPLVASVGDRILIRRYSPMNTIAGAEILDVSPSRHRRSDEHAVDLLKVRAKGDPLETLSSMVQGAGLAGVASSEAVRRSSLTIERVGEEAEARGWLVLEDRLLGKEFVEDAVGELSRLLGVYHEEHPLRRGLSSEEVAVELGIQAGGVVQETVLKRAMEEGLVEKDPPFWRRKGFSVEFAGFYGQAVEALIAISEERDVLPLSLSEIEEVTGSVSQRAGLKKDEAAELLDALVHQGRLIRCPGGFFLSEKGYEKLVGLLRGHFKQHSELMVTEFRDLSGGLTRKYVIPILECMDAKGVTIRRGDVRVPGPALK